MRTIHIEHLPTYASITVEIDDDWKNDLNQSVNSVMKANLMFWMEGGDRIDYANGNIEQAYLKMLCEESVRIMAGLNCGPIGLISEFENREGWSPVNGDYGIRISQCEPPEFNGDQDYLIKEVPS